MRPLTCPLVEDTFLDSDSPEYLKAHWQAWKVFGKLVNAPNESEDAFLDRYDGLLHDFVDVFWPQTSPQVLSVSLLEPSLAA